MMNQFSTQFTTDKHHNHKKEWEASAITPSLIEANLISLPPTTNPLKIPEAFYLLHQDGEDSLERRNDGRLTNAALQKIKAKFLVNGGWYAQGFNLLTGERDSFLCYKPNSPRIDFKTQKPIKYEHPRKRSTGIFVPAIPHCIANKIAFRVSGDIFAKWEKFRDSYDGDPEFAIWEFAKIYAIALHVTEGYKKTASLISHGFLCVGLPGVWNWIDKDAETYIDFKGKKSRKKKLTSLLKPLTMVKREVTLWFDEDTKKKTIKNVNSAQTALGKAFSKEGCKISIASWNSQDGKGIDDAITTKGKQWLEKVYQRRLSLSAWLYWNQRLNHVDRSLNKQFLTKDDIDTAAKLIGLKSAKGTGKTEAMADYIHDKINQGIPVILLSHRVQLVEALSERFGIDSIYNFRDSDTKGVLGLALCVDSLHAESKANFNPYNWDDFILIVDEVEQVIPHTLISNKTAVADHRTEVLANLTTLAQNASQIILSDADLSDRALNYFSSLTGNCNQKIIFNNFQPSQGRKLFNYPSPESWLQALTSDLDNPETKILIPTDSQKAKSTWGAQTLETYINLHYPDRKVLRIDSETVVNPEHPAYGITKIINKVLIGYDVVIYTPVLGTGISIDIKGHFDAVYSVNQGTQSENSTRQFLARLRDDVPRHCYFKPMGVNFLGNGETEARAVKRSTKAVTKRNLANLKKLEDQALEFESFETHTNAYCCYVANHNLGMLTYREIVLEGLRAEGYKITDCSELKNEDKEAIKQQIKAIRDENYEKQNQAIAQIETPSDSELAELESKKELTDSQRHKLRKGKIEKLYGMEADQELIKQDDDGLYPQLSLLFWLTVGRDRVVSTDLNHAENYIKKTGGKGYDPDFNRTQSQAKVQVLELLRIPELLALEGQKITNKSLAWWWEHIEGLFEKHYNTKSAIKQFLGVTISDRETPIQNIRRLLKRVGYKLTRIKQLGENNKRQRVYQIERVTQKQDDIFAYWSRERGSGEFGIAA